MQAQIGARGPMDPAAANSQAAGPPHMVASNTANWVIDILTVQFADYAICA